MSDTANDRDDDRDEFDEYEELDPDQVAEDAIEYFDKTSETDSPTAVADIPPPG